MTGRALAPRRSLADPDEASRLVHWILRWGVWACFVGHGMFGIKQKPEWLIFFQPFGVSEEMALTLMPLVGLVDVTLGFLALLRPTRLVFMYTAMWGVFTGMLRPLVGMSVFELLERAGNYGPSLALLLGTGGAALLSAPTPYDLSEGTHADRIRKVLALTTGLLLLGHGGLALSAKPMLVAHWHSIGLAPDHAAESVTRIAGGGEVMAALVVLLWPTRLLCLAVVGWKLLTEMLFITAGAPAWEVLERGGSYAAPLALFVVLSYQVGRARRAASEARDASVADRGLVLRAST